MLLNASLDLIKRISRESVEMPDLWPCLRDVERVGSAG
jgi:hypothetical protein